MELFLVSRLKNSGFFPSKGQRQGQIDFFGIKLIIVSDDESLGVDDAVANSS